MAHKVAAIWTRVSDLKEEEPSLDRQVATVKPWLEEEGYIVPEGKVIKVIWTSKKILDCPEIQLLLHWVQPRQVDTIAMTHLDRLSGKPGHMARIIETIKEAGCKLLAKNTPLPSGIMDDVLGIVVSLAKCLQVNKADVGAKDGLRGRAIRQGLVVSMG